MSKINYATISDSILSNDVKERVIAEHDHVQSAVSEILKQFGFNGEEEHPNWILILSDKTTCYSKDLVTLLHASYMALKDGDIFIFEFEKRVDVINYLIEYHSGTDFGIDEISR
jgi:hypothetical protein